MSNYDLMLSIQSLRENIISANVTNKKLQEELRINNMIKLLEHGLISREALDAELLGTISYRDLTKKKIKAKTK